MVMYKPLFQDSIIAVSIAVRYTISPKLVIRDATFYYISSLLKNCFFFQIGVNFGQFVNSRYLQSIRVFEFFPPFFIFSTMTFCHWVSRIKKLTPNANGGHFEYLDCSKYVLAIVFTIMYVGRVFGVTTMYFMEILWENDHFFWNFGTFWAIFSHL